ncbi:hypothetical protein MYX82_07925 [Acidobacteria bacterium AH-259-D05]|nr:hypothetical protein [Acidobacteria bacterium AH-259-D05]
MRNCRYSGQPKNSQEKHHRSATPLVRRQYWWKILRWAKKKERCHTEIGAPDSRIEVPEGTSPDAPDNDLYPVLGLVVTAHHQCR